MLRLSFQVHEEEAAIMSVLSHRSNLVPLTTIAARVLTFVI